MAKGKTLAEVQVDWYGELTFMIPLALLWGEATTPQIRERVFEQTGLTLTEKNVWPLLKRLEQYEWITSRKELLFHGGQHRNMKIYSLTSKGTRHLRRALDRIVSLGEPLLRQLLADKPL